MSFFCGNNIILIKIKINTPKNILCIFAEVKKRSMHLISMVMWPKVQRFHDNIGRFYSLVTCKFYNDYDFK